MNLTIPQFPNYSITIKKFAEISNISEIKSELLSLNPKYNYSFINPKTILSIEQLSCAIYRALLDYNSKNARTKSIHSEIIFDLGKSNKIGENLINFGISEELNELIIVRINEFNETELNEIIKGREIEINDTECLKSCDVDLIKKIYSIETDDDDTLNRLIINSIQLRGL